MAEQLPGEKPGRGRPARETVTIKLGHRASLGSKTGLVGQERGCWEVERGLCGDEDADGPQTSSSEQSR